MENIKAAENGCKSSCTTFYSTKQVAQCLGCSIPTARQLFCRRDFPALKIGKNYRVEKSAFEKWCSERRV